MNSQTSIHRSLISGTAFVFGMVGAAAIGAAAVFLLDPEMGKRRRDQLADKLTLAGRKLFSHADRLLLDAEQTLHPAADETLQTESSPLVDMTDLDEDYPDSQLHS